LSASPPACRPSRCWPPSPSARRTRLLPPRLRERLAAEGIHAPEPASLRDAPALLLGVNETWNRTTGTRLAAAFAKAGSASNVPGGTGPAA